MVLNISVNNTEEYYKRLLEILTPLKPFNKIRGKSMELLRDILCQEYLLREEIPDFSKRNRIIFSKQNIEDRCDKLGIKKNNYYVLKKDLTDYSILIGNGQDVTLNKTYVEYLDPVKNLSEGILIKFQKPVEKK